MKVLLICTLIICLAGCKNNHQRPTSTTETADDATAVTDTTCVNITINPASHNKEDFHAFDTLIDSISYIKLETRDDCLIGAIDQLLCTDRYIFVMDIFLSQSVYCFDRNGRFVRKIGGVGQGPGEYARLCKMALTANRQQLAIYDWARVHYYDLDGRHIKDETLGKSPSDIDFVPGAKVLFTNAGNDQPNNEMLTVYDDRNDTLLHAALPTFYTTSFQMNQSMITLRRFGAELYMQAPWTETIYQVTKEQSFPAYHIDIVGGGHPEITDDINMEEYLALKGKRYVLDDFVILPHHAVFYFYINGQQWSPFAIYSKKTKKTYVCGGGAQNPFFPMQLHSNTPLERFDENTFVLPQSAAMVLHFKNLIRKKATDANSKIVQGLYDNFTEESNPVLFLIHINPDL